MRGIIKLLSYRTEQVGFKGKASEHGATVLEFSIVFPIFILFIIAIFDFSRFLYLQALVTHWADEALGVAQIVPGLDAEANPGDPPALLTQVESLRTEARKQVEDRALTLTTAGFFSARKGEGNAWLEMPPVLVTPAPAPGKTLQQTFEEQPLAFTIQAQVKPLLPFLPNFQIFKRVSGYREIRRTTALPILTDCAGNTIGSPLYNSSACSACPSPRMRLNKATGQCSCLTGLVLTPSQKDCVCPNDRYQYVSGSGCSTCRAPLVLRSDGGNQYCDCPSGFTTSRDAEGNYTCSCLTTCSAGMFLNRTTCKCDCATGPTIEDEFGSRSCGKCPSPLVWQGSHCGCPVEPQCDPETEFQNNCGCSPRPKECLESCGAGTYCFYGECSSCPNDCDKRGFAYNCTCKDPPPSIPPSSGGDSNLRNDSGGDGDEGNEGDSGGPTNVPGNVPTNGPVNGPFNVPFNTPVGGPGDEE